MKQLDDYIKIYNDVLTKESCEIILSRFHGSNLWKNDCINLNDRSLREAHQDIDDRLFRAVNKTALLYRQDVPEAVFRRDFGYELMRFQEPELYLELRHDTYEERSELNCIFSLNDNYQGGGYEFFLDGHLYKTPAGSALVYPANFLYKPRIWPVTKGTYNIATTSLL